jgi:hypothetical protein
MQEELESFKRHGVYKIVAKPEGEKILSTRWVFTQKRDEEGEVKRWKARIVARGYRQREGIDYDELFVPIVRFETIRTLLATAVGKNEPLRQWDVVTAYLHAPLDRPLYTTPPEGVDVPDGHVWQLIKSVYGLKQAAQLWNQTLHQAMTDIGLKRSSADPGRYIGNKD